MAERPEQCRECAQDVGDDGGWIVHTRKRHHKVAHYHLCSKCFDDAAYKNVRKCPGCFNWHDQDDTCPICGELARNPNEVVHER